MQLRAAADASFAMHLDGKSHTGTAIWFGMLNAPVLVGVKKQTLVTRSSSEAEMVALCSVAEEVMWFRWLLEEIGFPQKTTIVEQDNKSVIQMQEAGPGKVGRGRYINVKFYFVHDLIQDKHIALTYVATDTMIADGLTKGLVGSKFVSWTRRLLNDHGFFDSGKVEDRGRRPGKRARVGGD